MQQPLQSQDCAPLLLWHVPLRLPPPGERMALQILEAYADVIRDNLGMEFTTSVLVRSVAASSKNPIALYIALEATFVVMVLIRLILFIGHWYRGEVF